MVTNDMMRGIKWKIPLATTPLKSLSQVSTASGDFATRRTHATHTAAPGQSGGNKVGDIVEGRIRVPAIGSEGDEKDQRYKCEIKLETRL